MIDSHDKTSLMAKIALVGARESGKSTFIKKVYQKFPSTHRGEMSTLDSQGDTILCLEIMPSNLKPIDKKEIHFQLAAMEGDLSTDLGWQLLLEDSDAILFFASSKAGEMDNNIKALQDLEENMAVLGISWPSIPVLFIYNGRDMESIYTIEELNAKLNRTNAEAFETAAKRGQGVFRVLKAVINYVYDNITNSRNNPELEAEEETPEKKDENLSADSGKQEDDVINFNTPSGKDTDEQQETGGEESDNVQGNSKIGFFGRLGFKRKK